MLRCEILCLTITLTNLSSVSLLSFSIMFTQSYFVITAASLFTQKQLVHVALLKQEPGASFTLGDKYPVPCIYSSGEHFRSEDTTYDITVTFTSINPGLYEQWLVLDFGMRPMLLKKLRVKTSHLSLNDNKEHTGGQRSNFKSVERWHRESTVVSPCLPRTEEEEELLKQYNLPQISVLHKSYKSRTPLTNENYKERMHHFLFNEERAEEEIVSR